MSGEFFFLNLKETEGKRKKKRFLSYLLNMSRYFFFSPNQKAKHKIQNPIKGRVHLIKPLNKNTSPYPLKKKRKEKKRKEKIIKNN
jgi:hypothetical protein